MCCVVGLSYTAYFQTYVVLEVTRYVVLEVKHVVLYVYHTQHTFKHNLCLRSTWCAGGLPYTTYFQTYIVLEVTRYVVLEVSRVGAVRPIETVTQRSGAVQTYFGGIG